MSKLFRTAVLGAVALAALITSAVPAGANLALDGATISSDETVGGDWVRYTASATYVTTTPGVATVACNVVAIVPAVRVPGAYCWLDDLNSSDYWETIAIPYFQAGYNVGEFVIDRPRRLRLCMYAYWSNTSTYAPGPTRCANLT